MASFTPKPTAGKCTSDNLQAMINFYTSHVSFNTAHKNKLEHTLCQAKQDATFKFHTPATHQDTAVSQ